VKEFGDVTSEDIERHYKIILNNIKKYRKERKVTQEMLALAMGFTTATFYTNAENYKSGKRFNLEHIIKISIILDVEIENLFKEV